MGMKHGFRAMCSKALVTRMVHNKDNWALFVPFFFGMSDQGCIEANTR
jgi:hypothetical protein